MRNKYADYHRYYPQNFLKLMKTFLNPNIRNKKELYTKIENEYNRLLKEKRPYYCPQCDHFHKAPSKIYEKHLEHAKNVNFLSIHCDPIEKIYVFPIYKHKDQKKEMIKEIPIGVPLRLKLDEKQWSEGEKKNFTLHDRLDNLNWTAYKKVKTRYGKKMVSSTKMTLDLWDFWKKNKKLLKSAGYSISKYYSKELNPYSLTFQYSSTHSSSVIQGWKISRWKDIPKSKMTKREKKSNAVNAKLITLDHYFSSDSKKKPKNDLKEDSTEEKLDRNNQIEINRIEDLKKLCWSKYIPISRGNSSYFLRKSTPISPIILNNINKNQIDLKKFGYSLSKYHKLLHHKKLVEKLSDILPEKAKYLDSLQWSEVKEVVSSSGKLNHVKDTPMNEELWKIWEEKKQIMRKLGYSITQYEDSWNLNQWVTPREANNDMEEDISIAIYYEEKKLGYIPPSYEDEVKSLLNNSKGKILCFLTSNSNYNCKLHLVDFDKFFQYLHGLIEMANLVDLDIYQSIRDMGSEAVILDGLFLYLDKNLDYIDIMREIFQKCYNYDDKPPTDLVFRYIQGEPLTQKEIAELISKATYKERQILESVLPPDNPIQKRLNYLYKVKTSDNLDILL